MDTIFLGAIALGLAMYALRLQRKVRTYEHLIAGTAEMLIDIADNKLKIVRTVDGVHIKQVEVGDG
jgi:hypothetical protein